MTLPYARIGRPLFSTCDIEGTKPFTVHFAGTAAEVAGWAGGVGVVDGGSEPSEAAPEQALSKRTTVRTAGRAKPEIRMVTPGP